MNWTKEGNMENVFSGSETYNVLAWMQVRIGQRGRLHLQQNISPSKMITTQTITYHAAML
jgi:hypothetical protein